MYDYVWYLKERTLGNSPTRLHAQALEQQTEEWMSPSMLYPRSTLQNQGTLPLMPAVPSVPWLLSVYVREACTRLEETKARVTSSFGDILKMDSTKKASFDNNRMKYSPTLSLAP